MSTASLSSQSVPVYAADQIRATDGANMGDVISFASELILDDVYELDFGAEPARLSLAAHDYAPFAIGNDTSIGTPGGTVHLDSTLTFMLLNGTTAATLLLVEVDERGGVVQIYLLPFSAMAPKPNTALWALTATAHIQNSPKSPA